MADDTQAWRIIKAMKQQANAHLPEDEQLSVSAHRLRHTNLRKIAEQRISTLR